MINVLKYFGSIFIVIIATILSNLLIKKAKMNVLVKYILVGLIFGISAIGCSFLKVVSKDGFDVSFANTAVLFGGIFFGGPVGLIAGLVSGIERFFSIYYGGLITTRYAVSLSLIFSGILGTFLRRFIYNNGHYKWLVGGVFSLIVESFYLLLIFLTNLDNLSYTYEICNSVGLVTIGVNVVAILLVFFVVLLIYKIPHFNLERPTGIQSKIQLSLALAIIVGFGSISGIVYGVLNNNSKESVRTSISTSINDVKNNLEDDIDADLITAFKKSSTSMKQNLVTRLKDVKRLEESLEYYDISECTIFENGVYSVGNDAAVTSLEDYEKIGVKLPTTEEDNITTDYQYIEAKNGYYKYIASWFNLGKTSLVVGNINSEDYYKFLTVSINKGIAARHLGENGYILVLDKDNNVISSPDDKFKGTLKINLLKPLLLNVSNIDGVEYYSYVDEIEGYYLVALMNKAETDLNMNISLWLTALTEVLVFFLLYSIIYLSIKKTVIKPLQKVNDSLDIITKGKLDERVEEYSSKELKILSEDINQTVDSLKEYMGKEARLIQKELNFAKEIQYSSLPQNFPINDRFEIYASMNAAKEVGGDFYDFYFVDDKHLCILIADVSGKGVPAALFMMQSKTILKSFIESKIKLDEAFTIANKKLCETNKAQMFVTAWCGILDLDTGVLEFVNAGHNPPLLKLKDSYEYLNAKKGFVLAGLENMSYKTQSIKLEPNSQLFLYTDGVSEANSINLELFNEERLLDSCNTHKDCGPEEFCKKVLEDVNNFVLEAEQSDDITMLCIKYLKNK